MSDDSFPIIKLAAATLQRAIADGANQIRLRPTERSTSIHFLAGSDWKHVMTVPRNITSPYLDRFRHLAQGDEDMPAGCFRFSDHGRTYEVSVTEAVEPVEMTLLIKDLPRLEA